MMREGSRRDLPVALSSFFALLLVLSGVMWVVQMHYDHSRHPLLYPYASPLFRAYSYHFDFGAYAGRFSHFGTAEFFAPGSWPFTYPAAVALVYRAFYAFGRSALPLFLGFSYVAYGLAAAGLAWGMARRGVAPALAVGFAGVTALLSYPAWLQLFLANMEVVVFAVVTLGFWAYVTGRERLAATCFAVAGAMKIFPAIFLALFLPRRRWAALGLGLLVFLGVSAGSLFVVGPTAGETYRGIQSGIAQFERLYVNQFNGFENGMDHSLFALVKLTLVRVHREALLHAASVVYLGSVALGGLAVYVLRIWRLPATNQILLLAIASVMLPPLSHDYTLLNLYGPFGLLVLVLIEQRGRPVAGAGFLMVGFAILFSQQNWLILQHGMFHDLRVSGQLKAVVLLMMFVVALWRPLPELGARRSAAA